MVNHGPMSHCNKDCLNMKINHGQPSLTMVDHGQHGPTSHLDKDCLTMKINIGQPWSNMVSHGQSLLTMVNHC